MRIPVIRGLIDRRILVNYRVEPAVLAGLLPRPFRPKLVAGWGLAGICLIRLKHLRPPGWPARWGLASENAAHRVAVEWDEQGITRQGVFVLRRDTDSRLNALAGGRLFPGVHHHATFAVRESADRYSVSFRSDDGAAWISLRGTRQGELPSTSVFGSLASASAFFQAGSLGYSPSRNRSRFNGLELRCFDWKVAPLAVEAVTSSYFDDRSLFAGGAVEYDSALQMGAIEHEWHGRSDLYAPESGAL